MRCPVCQHNQKYKDGSRCGGCGYQFVLRRKSDNFSDLTLMQMCRRLSDNGQYYFTRTQLALEICRFWRRKNHEPLGCAIVASLAGMLIIGFSSGWDWSLMLLLGGVGLLSGWFSGSRSKNTQSLKKALEVIRKYQRVHPLDQLVEGTAFREGADPGDDLHYAPGHILIVERDELVDMLIHNRFHLTNRTAVVSRSGYPARVAAACRIFLKKYPQTPVQCLHDGSRKGFTMAAALKNDREWGGLCAHLTDIGLSRHTLVNAGASLPWVKDGKDVIFSRNHGKMLKGGRRVPVDHAPPKQMMTMLAAAVAAGALLLPAHDAGGVDGGGESDSYG